MGPIGIIMIIVILIIIAGIIAAVTDDNGEGFFSLPFMVGAVLITFFTTRATYTEDTSNKNTVPTAMDVYRGNTAIRTTVKYDDGDSISCDSTVIFKQ